METTYIVRVTAVDEVGQEVLTTIPMRTEEEPVVEDIERQLDQQYPHLKHKVTEMTPLKTPDQVENWHQSYLGTIFGTEDYPDDPNKND